LKDPKTKLHSRNEKVRGGVKKPKKSRPGRNHFQPSVGELEKFKSAKREKEKQGARCHGRMHTEVEDTGNAKDHSKNRVDQGLYANKKMGCGKYPGGLLALKRKKQLEKLRKQTERFGPEFLSKGSCTESLGKPQIAKPNWPNPTVIGSAKQQESKER